MGAQSLNRRLYHITHVDNLASIMEQGELLSDARLLARGGPAISIGIGDIKSRRMTLPVKCHPGDRVGDYVPFYFCPRSVMLYLIYRANHPNLAYKGGQDPILHLEYDLGEVVQWARERSRRWAFTLSNAAVAYAEFRSRLEELREVDWDAVRSTNFSSPEVKEGKQAEFLVRDSVDWALVVRVGVRSAGMAERVERLLGGQSGRPSIEVRPEWYY